MPENDSTTEKARGLASEIRNVDPKEFITLTTVSGASIRIRPRLVLAIAELVGAGSLLTTSIGVYAVREDPAEVERICVERSVERWAWRADEWALAGDRPKAAGDGEAAP